MSRFRRNEVGICKEYAARHAAARSTEGRMLPCAVSIFLAIILALSWVLPSFALYSDPDSPDYGEYTIKQNVDMWHYKEGYWEIVEPDGNVVRYTDAKVAEYEDFTAFINTIYFKFKLDLPDRIKNDKANGFTISSSYVADTSTTLGYFISGQNYSYFVGDTLYFCAKPKGGEKLNSKRLDEYVAGLKVYIPVPDYTVANNIYRVYQKSGNNYTELGLVLGKFDSKSKLKKKTAGYINPWLISNDEGLIDSSNTISFIDGAQKVTPNSYYIGTGNFSEGEGIGIRFEYSFRLHLTGKYEEKPAVEEPVNKITFYYHRRK